MTIIDKACWERGCPCHDIGDEGVEVQLAQPEPEPVAWMFQHQETGNVTFFDNPTMAKLFKETNVRWDGAIPLYTQPTCQENRHVADNATREWVGLTDDEYEQFSEWTHIEIIERIVTTLKEKNT